MFGKRLFNFSSRTSFFLPNNIIGQTLQIDVVTFEVDFGCNIDQQELLNLVSEIYQNNGMNVQFNVGIQESTPFPFVNSFTRSFKLSSE